MAKIVVKIKNIEGESDQSGYANQLAAVAIRETLEMSVGSPTDALHSDIMLVRVRDRGSPKLAQACADGENLGEVVISLLKSGGMCFMEYKLVNAYVSRYEYDTPDDRGLAYMPHFGSPGQPMAEPVYGVASMVDAPAPSRVRLSPRPVVSQPRGQAGDIDIERLWFNSEKVEWTYNSLDDAGNTVALTKKWNIRASEDY